MLDPEKIRQLIDMMVANDLVEISLRDGDQEVNLRRPNPDAAQAGRVMMPPAMSAAMPLAAPAAAAPAAPETKDKSDDDLVPIPSPMVGTFYAAPDPDSPPYVQAGQHVHPDTVVCIVEAMKVFNEIKAEVDGVVERILVKNEQAVEYGQPLFLVRP